MSCLQISKRIFLPFCMLLASAVLNAQNISLSLRSVPVSKAITEIQKTSGYSIVVKSDGLDLSRQVSVNAENEDIRTVIGNVFAGQDVEVTVSGKRELTKVTIDPDAVDPDDMEMLQDMIIAAANEALRAAEDDAAKAMGGLTGGLTGGMGGFGF